MIGHQRAKVLIDVSRTRRTLTGIEVVSEQMVESLRASGVACEIFASASRVGFLWNQFVRVPRATALTDSHVLFPGFPPSTLQTLLFSRRNVVFVHDLFLLEQGPSLPGFARIYLAPGFRFALSRARHVVVYSDHMRRAVTPILAKETAISLCRPHISNRFSLRKGEFSQITRGRLDVIMIGTVEPRKGYLRALAVSRALEDLREAPVHLHIVGRPGWGPDSTALAAAPNVTLYGYLSAAQLATLVSHCHFGWFSSYDEGLGLPPLELAFSGIPIVVSDIPSFVETMGGHALVVDWEKPAAAASMIHEYAMSDHRPDTEGAVDQWNVAAARDLNLLITALGAA
jgi:glycosyltransferase involved in cell wall biosynthesis